MQAPPSISRRHKRRRPLESRDAMLLHKRINAGAPLNLEGLARCAKRWFPEIQGGVAVYAFTARTVRQKFVPGFPSFKGAHTFMVV